MNTLHLVIQGPILSSSPRFGGKEKHDSTESILHSIDKYAPSCKSIQIVTWLGEPVDALQTALAERQHSNVFLQEIDDPGRGRDWFGTAPDNRLRQYASSLAGLLAANQHGDGDDVCLKLRTDQVLDVSRLAGELDRSIAHDPDRIVFPFANLPDLYSVGDFYVGGRLGQLTGLFRYLVDTMTLPVGSRSVHVDIAQKYILFRRGLQPPADMRFVLAGKAASRPGCVPLRMQDVAIWAADFCQYFGLFSHASFDAMVWRGEKFGAAHSFLFSDDVTDVEAAHRAMARLSRRRVVDRSIVSGYVFGMPWAFRLSGGLQAPIYRLEFRLRQALLRL